MEFIVKGFGVFVVGDENAQKLVVFVEQLCEYPTNKWRIVQYVNCMSIKLLPKKLFSLFLSLVFMDLINKYICFSATVQIITGRYYNK